MRDSLQGKVVGGVESGPTETSPDFAAGGIRKPFKGILRHSSVKPGLVLAGIAMLLGGCTAPVEDTEISHVHGIAYDANGDTVYLASHHGLARGVREGADWTWSYVGAEKFDYMGFTKDTTAPGVFYSSGHPDDHRAFGGFHLGLRRSTDGGVTWEQRSLKGQVDFHALTALHGGEGHLAGYWQGAIKVSQDGGLTWTDHAAPPTPVVALGSSTGKVWAGTTTGLYAAETGAAPWAWTKMPGPSSGIVSSIAASTDGRVLLAGTGDGSSGATFRSPDAGATWTPMDHPQLADAPGQVLFTVEGGVHAFAALGNGGVLESRDLGATWTKVR